VSEEGGAGVKSALDQELRDFIGASLGSVWALELLLLLRRTRPRRWPAAELVAEMRASATLVSESIAGLERAGLVACDPETGCAYAPASPVLEAACEQLEAAYKNRPVAVVNAIVTAPKQTLQTFADAFRVQGKGESK